MQLTGPYVGSRETWQRPGAWTRQNLKKLEVGDKQKAPKPGKGKGTISTSKQKHGERSWNLWTALYNYTGGSLGVAVNSKSRRLSS